MLRRGGQHVSTVSRAYKLSLHEADGYRCDAQTVSAGLRYAHEILVIDQSSFRHYFFEYRVLEIAEFRIEKAQSNACPVNAAFERSDGIDVSQLNFR